MKTKIRILFFLCLLPLAARASDVTHLLGTTGYMIREAMNAKANKKDPENYREALRLQSEAKKAFRGTRKKGRNLEDVVELTRQAYGLAKLARDNSQAWPYKNSRDNFYRSVVKAEKTKKAGR
jgi:hypothetical protein